MRGSAGFSPRERFGQIKHAASAAEGTNFEFSHRLFSREPVFWSVTQSGRRSGVNRNAS
jgi:hypothetical protein